MRVWKVLSDDEVDKIVATPHASGREEVRATERQVLAKLDIPVVFAEQGRRPEQVRDSERTVFLCCAGVCLLGIGYLIGAIVQALTHARP